MAGSGINVRLEGLNLSEDEQKELHDILKQKVVEYLKDRAAPIDTNLVAMGPGWIGIRAREQ